MATSTFFPTGYTNGNNAWSSGQTNIYADDTSSASVTAYGKNTTYELIGRMFKASGATIASTIPAGRTLTSVTITAAHANNANDSSGPLFWLIAYDGSTTIGTGTQDTTGTTSEEVYTYDGTAPTLAQLRSANFKVGINFRRSDDTAHVHTCDYVKVVVVYSDTTPLATTASSGELSASNATLSVSPPAVEMATTASSGVMTAAASPTRRAYVVTSGSRGGELTASNATLSVSSPVVEMATTASVGEMTAASVPTRHAYVVTSGTLNGILTASSAALDGTGGGTTEITATAASGELTASSAVLLRARPLAASASRGELTASGLTLAVGKTLTTTASAGELTAASASLLRSRVLSASPASGELSAATVPTRYAYSIDSGTISGELTASSVDLDRIVYAVPSTGELVAATVPTRYAYSIDSGTISGELTASSVDLDRIVYAVPSTGELVAAVATLTKAATSLTAVASSGELTASAAVLTKAATVIATAASSGSLTATTLDVSVLRIISTVRYTKTAQHGGTPDTITHQARAQVNGGSPVVTARRARTRR